MFYEENAAAKRPELTVMKAKSGQVLRCKPHSCPTKLDIEKINKVYNCKQNDSKTGTTKPSDEISIEKLETNNCTSLEWKSRQQMEKETNNPVVFQEMNGEMVYICRAKLWNGDVILGKVDKNGCWGTNISGFSWNFIKYDTLNNLNNVKIKWIRASNPPKNAVFAGKKGNRDVFVRKCIYNLKRKTCLNMKYLICLD
jgi:hypothetical protein